MKTLFFSLLLIIFFIGCQDAEPATYYLSKGFEGVFAVVYSQNMGFDKFKNGRHQFYIPTNCILLTKYNFSDGGRDDIFLMPLNDGFDTLKNYMPNKNTTGKQFDSTYYKSHTSDSNEIAVNHRQIISSTFNKFDLDGNKIGDCSFQYELITIGKATFLNDSIGKAFKIKLENYLQEKLCK